MRRVTSPRPPIQQMILPQIFNLGFDYINEKSADEDQYLNFCFILSSLELKSAFVAFAQHRKGINILDLEKKHNLPCQHSDTLDQEKSINWEQLEEKINTYELSKAQKDKIFQFGYVTQLSNGEADKSYNLFLKIFKYLNIKDEFYVYCSEINVPQSAVHNDRISDSSEEDCDDGWSSSSVTSLSSGSSFGGTPDPSPRPRAMTGPPTQMKPSSSEEVLSRVRGFFSPRHQRSNKKSGTDPNITTKYRKGPQ